MEEILKQILSEVKGLKDDISDIKQDVKVDIEYLSSKTGKHDTELNHILHKLRG